MGGRRLLPFLYRHLRKFKLITLHTFHVHRDAFSERIFAAILTFNASCQSWDDWMLEQTTLLSHEFSRVTHLLVVLTSRPCCFSRFLLLLCDAARLNALIQLWQSWPDWLSWIDPNRFLLDTLVSEGQLVAFLIVILEGDVVWLVKEAGHLQLRFQFLPLLVLLSVAYKRINAWVKLAVRAIKVLWAQCCNGAAIFRLNSLRTFLTSHETAHELDTIPLGAFGSLAQHLLQASLSHIWSTDVTI